MAMGKNWTAAGTRQEALPPEFGSKYGTNGTTLRFSGWLQRQGLTPTEAIAYGWALWRAGDDLDYPVNKADVARQASKSRPVIARAFAAMVRGGLLQVRTDDLEDIHVPGRPTGQQITGFIFPAFDDLAEAIAAYKASPAAKARASKTAMRFYRYATQTTVARATVEIAPTTVARTTESTVARTTESTVARGSRCTTTDIVTDKRTDNPLTPKGGSGAVATLDQPKTAGDTPTDADRIRKDWATATGDPEAKPPTRQIQRVLKQKDYTVERVCQAIPMAWATYKAELEKWQAGKRGVAPTFTMSNVAKACSQPLNQKPAVSADRARELADDEMIRAINGDSYRSDNVAIARARDDHAKTLKGVWKPVTPEDQQHLARLANRVARESMTITDAIADAESCRDAAAIPFDQVRRVG